MFVAIQVSERKQVVCRNWDLVHPSIDMHLKSGKEGGDKNISKGTMLRDSWSGCEAGRLSSVMGAMCWSRQRLRVDTCPAG
jgi:hypothetical protein